MGGSGGNNTPPAATETGFRSLPFAISMRFPSSGVLITAGAGGGSGSYAHNMGNKAVGGSGGGGGGVIILVYGDITLGTVTVDGGTKSAGGTSGTGTLGAVSEDGSAGTILQIGG